MGILIVFVLPSICTCAVSVVVAVDAAVRRGFGFEESGCEGEVSDARENPFGAVMQCEGSHCTRVRALPSLDGFA